MALVYRQLSDGVLTGEEMRIQSPNLEWDDLRFLRWKAEEHAAKRWTVEWTGPTSFHAWKEYPENVGVRGAPVRKDRFFEVR